MGRRLHDALPLTGAVALWPSSTLIILTFLLGHSAKPCPLAAIVGKVFMLKRKRPISYYVIASCLALIGVSAFVLIFWNVLFHNAIGFRMGGASLGFKASEILRSVLLLTVSLIFGLLFIKTHRIRDLSLALASGIGFLLFGSWFSMSWTSYPPGMAPENGSFDPMSLYTIAFYLKIGVGAFMGLLVGLAILRGPFRSVGP
jgi:hypothetical protein